MFIEERVEGLEENFSELNKKLDEICKPEKWLSVAELAKIMGCSKSNIYIKVNSGEIYATRLLGSPRIPLSQFYGKEVKVHGKTIEP